MPEVECFEALLNVEKALCNNKNMYCFLLWTRPKSLIIHRLAARTGERLQLTNKGLIFQGSYFQISLNI
jgi:hypothetical protein